MVKYVLACYGATQDAVWSSIEQNGAAWYSIVHHAKVWCRTLQYPTILYQIIKWCSIEYNSVLCYNNVQYDTALLGRVYGYEPVICNMIQHGTLWCSMRQHGAVCSSMKQHEAWCCMILHITEQCGIVQYGVVMYTMVHYSILRCSINSGLTHILDHWIDKESILCCFAGKLQETG